MVAFGTLLIHASDDHLYDGISYCPSGQRFCFFFFLMLRHPPSSPLFPSPTLSRSLGSAPPAGPAPAVPCWKAFINDCFDGRLAQPSPPQCYQQALHHLPRDVDLYSSANDD